MVRGGSGSSGIPEGTRTGPSIATATATRMATIMRTLGLLGLITLLVGCDGALSDAESVALDRAFELAPGQEVRVDGADLTLRLIQIAEDSRCPADIACVWEGNARAVLEVVRDDEERGIALNTSHDPRVGPHAAEIGGYRIELLDLSPPPSPGDTIARDRYRATLRVSAID